MFCDLSTWHFFLYFQTVFWVICFVLTAFVSVQAGLKAGNLLSVIFDLFFQFSYYIFVFIDFLQRKTQKYCYSPEYQVLYDDRL